MSDIDGLLQTLRIRWKWASEFEVTRDEFWALHTEIERLRALVPAQRSSNTPSPARRPGQVYATWCDECPYEGGCGNCTKPDTPSPAREAARRLKRAAESELGNEKEHGATLTVRPSTMLAICTALLSTSGEKP